MLFVSCVCLVDGFSETTCTLAKDFTAYVFKATSDNEVCDRYAVSQKTSPTFLIVTLRRIIRF